MEEVSFKHKFEAFRRVFNIYTQEGLNAAQAQARQYSADFTVTIGVYPITGGPTVCMRWGLLEQQVVLS